jgi:hypothetical protein
MSAVRILKTNTGGLVVPWLATVLLAGQVSNPGDSNLKVDIEVSSQRTCREDVQQPTTFMDFVTLKVTYRNEGRDDLTVFLDHDAVARYSVARSPADFIVGKTEWEVDRHRMDVPPGRPKLLNPGRSLTKEHVIDLTVTTGADATAGIRPGVHYLDIGLELVVPSTDGAATKRFLRARSPVRVEVPAASSNRKCKG